MAHAGMSRGLRELEKESIHVLAMSYTTAPKAKAFTLRWPKP